MIRCFALFATFIFLTVELHAQPRPGKEPTSTHIFPSGGQRGTVVKVRVGGECIPPGTDFMLTGVGVSASDLTRRQVSSTGETSPRRIPTEIPITLPREWGSEITIEDDARAGTAYWRLTCASGGTASRPFLIGDLPEWVETESNSTADQAERVELPITLNGQVNGERDVDYYRFSPPIGKVVVCELLAARIGSRLDGIIEILDSKRQVIPVQRIHQGTDPIIAFIATESSEYFLRISNVSWHGSPAHVYRINLTTRPFIHFCFPAGGQQGTEQQVNFFALTGRDDYQAMTQTVQFPAMADDEFIFGDASLAISGVRLSVDDSPNEFEREPNDSMSAMMKLPAPVTVNGQLQTAEDEDWFEFAATKGERISVTCRSYPQGGPALVTVTLLDAARHRLARSRSIESTDGVCRLEWQAPIDGQFLLRVADMQYGARGGPEFIYRLSLSKPKPNYSLSLVADNINLTQGNEVKVDISLRRIGGFDGAVEVHVIDLPEGVTVTGNVIDKGKTKGTLTLKATDEVGAASHTLRLLGRATIDNQPTERLAVGRHLGVDGQGVSVDSPTIDQIHLTILHKPLFRLQCSEHYQYAHRGTVYPYLMDVERLEDYDGSITLQQGDRQNRDMDGVQIHDAVIAAGETETIVPIYLPETMHINVQSQTQLYTQGYVQFVDKHGKQQSMLFLSEKRNMLRSLPPIVKLKTAEKTILASPGSTFRCRLSLQRTSNFTGPMMVVLLDPPVGFTAEPIRVADRQNELTLVVRVDDNVAFDGATVLRFRATGELYDGRRVITETTVSIQSE